MAALADSAVWLRATVMSTILPDVMLLGRRTEGNSIWGGLVEYQGYSEIRVDYFEAISCRLVRQSLAVSAWDGN